MRIVPIFVILAGPVLGAIAGIYLTERPELDAIHSKNETPRDYAAGALEGGDSHKSDPEVETDARSYVRIGRQMIVPIVLGGKTESLMMFDLAVDVADIDAERVHALEPRLRDAFLSVLFRMSSTGAFAGTYTEAHVIESLRRELFRAARRFLGEKVQDVLVLDVIRQEI